MSVETRRLALPAVLLLVLLCAAYAFSVGMRASRSASITGDEPFYLLTTQSLIDDRNLDLREQYERESYLVFFDHPDGLWKQSAADANGHIVSPHEPGLAVLLVPGFMLGELRGAQVQLLLIAAVTFSLAFVFAARETGRLWLPWGVTAVVGLSAPAFVFSTEIYPEIPAGLCLVVALLALRGLKGAWRSLALAASLTALAWLGLKYVPLGLVVAAAYSWQAPNRERAWFAGVAAVSGMLYLWGHLAWYGALTSYNGSLAYDGASTTAVIDSHFAFQDRAYRLWGLFIDRRFGIGRWAPIFLAILPALPLLLRGVRSGRLVAGLVATQIGVASLISITMMGWWFPGRMLVVVFPLFPFVLTVAMARLPTAFAALWAGLGGYSLVVTGSLAVAAHNDEVRIAVDPFDLQAPAFRLLGPLFPNYTSWGAETQVLNAAWLVLFGVLITASLILTFGSRRGPMESRGSVPAKAAADSARRLHFPVKTTDRSLSAD